MFVRACLLANFRRPWSSSRIFQQASCQVVSASERMAFSARMSLYCLPSPEK
jgi:hypothetical protein